MANTAKTKTVKFNQYFVTDGVNKARVSYNVDNRTDGRPVVTLYARDYINGLCRIFGEDVYEDNTDSMVDHFEKGTVRLFAGHPLYTIARERALHFTAKAAAKWDAKFARFGDELHSR